MTEIEIAWLAGLLEGEGSFACPPSDGQLRISLQMCDEDIVARVADMFGLAYHATRHHERNEKWRPAFRLTIRGQTRDIMKAIYPHMGIKRKQQIDVILAKRELFFPTKEK